MTQTDIITLLKKILIGIIVTLVPFAILFSGLWITQKFLSDKKEKPTSHKTSAP